MHTFWMAIICSLLPFSSIAQNPGDRQVSVVASLAKRVVQDSPDLKLRVSIKNNGLKDILVYKYLVEGYVTDWHCNLNLEVQQRGAHGFKEFSVGTLYQPAPDIDSSFSIERMELHAKDAIIHYLPLDDSYLFTPGQYRLRCIYRNDIGQNGRVFSSWVYFHVIKTIGISHRWN